MDDRFRNFMRHFLSMKTVIRTDECLNLEAKMRDWTDDNVAGAIVYGQPRAGKTTAIALAVEGLKKEFPMMPICQVTCSAPETGAVTSKRFFQRICDKMGLPYRNNDTSIALKKKIVNSIEAVTAGMEVRSSMLIMDEAHNLQPKEFSWLKELFNDLWERGVHLITILVGTQRLMEMRRSLICQNETEIVERFMSKDHHFNGVTDQIALMMLLNSLEHSEAAACLGGGTITKALFPVNAEKGRTIEDLAEPLWSALEACNENLPSEGVRMRVVKEALGETFRQFSKLGNGKAEMWPTAEMLVGCVRKVDSGRVTEKEALEALKAG